MKFNEQWCREWVNPPIDAQAIASQLTMAGLEVDSVTPVSGEFTGVVVGQVITQAKHPDADKLSVCTVDVGASDLLPIVCGAPNVRAGLKVAVAMVGARLPGDFKIKKSKLRGEPSHGMICSSKELGIETADDGAKGIMELPTDAPVGDDVREYLALDDHVIDIELTPNRGDCASIRGVAREIGVLTNCVVNAPSITMPTAIAETACAVNVSVPAVCPHYMVRVIESIRMDAITPRWMVQRLERSGLQCIHPVVDCLNYVMLEFGQPMHAFDLDQIQGDVHVRMATEDEQLTLLNQQTVELTESDCVIADGQRVLAVAGVMGGAPAGVTNSTTRILLESAFFDPIAIANTARRLGVQSDSSYRFERGVDCQLQSIALARATQLIIDIVGGQPGPVVDVVHEDALPAQTTILLRRERITRVLGIEIKDADVVQYLESLGMSLQTDKLGWCVQVPSFRFDVTQEVDLIEELARVHGYDNIPTHDAFVHMSLPRQSDQSVSLDRVIDFLVGQDYQEAITYSFVDAALQRIITPSCDAVQVDNPISSDMSVMRTQLFTGLMKTAQYNQNRQVARLRLFEVGQCFETIDGAVKHDQRLGLLMSGPLVEPQWGVEPRRVDFFDLKGHIEQLIGLSGQSGLSFERSHHPALHPGQSADIYLSDVKIGVVGVCHPSVAKAFDLRHPPVIAELSVDALLNYQLPCYQSLSKFPAVKRDLALVVDQAIEVRSLLRVVEQNTDSTLVDMEVFDVYEGEHIEKGKKSIALGLTFQDPSRTLLDADIDSHIQNIVNCLKDDLNATLRT